jgi:hypothetical protein
MALSLQPPKASKPKQARDGLCSVLGKRMTPEAGLEELKTTKANARLPCWLHLHPSVKPIDSKDPSKGKQVVLTCDVLQSATGQHGAMCTPRFAAAWGSHLVR